MRCISNRLPDISVLSQKPCFTVPPWFLGVHQVPSTHILCATQPNTKKITGYSPLNATEHYNASAPHSPRPSARMTGRVVPA